MTAVLFNNTFEGTWKEALVLRRNMRGRIEENYDNQGTAGPKQCISEHSHTSRQQSVPITEMAMQYTTPLRQTASSKTEVKH
jgi:hypothetical protein